MGFGALNWKSNHLQQYSKGIIGFLLKNSGSKSICVRKMINKDHIDTEIATTAVFICFFLYSLILH